ncbi:MAG: amidohydrolase family protein, partial [Planctomycetales bacterium]
PWKGLYVTHVRYKKGVLWGLREAVEIARRAETPLHVSHLKADRAEDVESLLEYIDRVAVNEVDFSFDVYPYVPGSTMLHSLLPYEVWEDGPLGVLPKLIRPEIRRRVGWSLRGRRAKLAQVRIAWTQSAANRSRLGMSIADYAEEVGKSLEDAVCDLLIEENLAVLAVFDRGEDRLVEPFLQHPRFMLGSDGIYFEDGLIHPRCHGSAPRVLGPMVRDRELFSLEEAVRKLSGFPASRFGLTDRGVLQEGAFADLAVFDPATITDRATYEEPHQLSRGVRWVFVNGVQVVTDGEPVTEFASHPPGRSLRFHD